MVAGYRGCVPDSVCRPVGGRCYVACVRAYLDLLDHVLTHGVDRSDRTGTGTRSVFGYQMRFDLSEGFPVLTTKKLHLKSIIGELLWFLRGDSNVALAAGARHHDLGRVGRRERRPRAGLRLPVALLADARTGGHIDQIARVIESIRTNPDSRRHIVSAWNVADVDSMALPPCHTMFQFYVTRPTTASRPRCPASSTSAPPTSSSACPSTSPPTRC